MTAISYQPGARYEEQLRIWANGNEDEHRLAVFLEARFPSAKEQKEEAYRKGFEEGRKYLRGFR